MNRFQRRASAPFLKVNSGEIEHPLRYIGSANLLRIRFEEEREKTRKDQPYSGSSESCDSLDLRSITMTVPPIIVRLVLLKR